jgi:hypothetical protein
MECTNRRIDRQTNKEADTQREREIHTHKAKEKYRDRDSLTEREKLTHRRANFLTHSQTDGHMERQTYELNTNGPTHRPVAKQADEVSQKDGKLLEWKIRNIKDAEFHSPHLFSPF